MGTFDQFNNCGELKLPSGVTAFGEIPWQPNASFEGVELKHIVTASQTGGKFSFHLVRIKPGKRIGMHMHDPQLETHEVIEGSGKCSNDGAEITYRPGVISIFPAGIPHEVIAGDDGLCLFAKFIPALC